MVQITPSNKRWIVALIAAGIGLGVLIGTTARSKRAHSLNTTSLEPQDTNGDHIPDITFHREESNVIRVEYDRNFDGVMDYFEWESLGSILRVEMDDNFDGKVDGWVFHKVSGYSEVRHDTDYNGVPDVFIHCEYQIPRLAIWRPNQTGDITRLEVFEGGVKVREFRDDDADGLLETELQLDRFENLLSTNKLEAPLHPKVMIDRILLPWRQKEVSQ